jgi:hypothetical protein
VASVTADVTGAEVLEETGVAVAGVDEVVVPPAANPVPASAAPAVAAASWRLEPVAPATTGAPARDARAAEILACLTTVPSFVPRET